jgi:uncharacterized membrane protein
MSIDVFIGVFGVIGGIAMIFKAYWLHHSVLPFNVAEKYLGSGNGTLGYQLLGVLIIIFGIAMTFGYLSVSPKSEKISNNTSSSSNSTNQPSPTIPQENSGFAN